MTPDAGHPVVGADFFDTLMTGVAPAFFFQIVNFSENRIQAVVYQVQNVGEQVKIEGHLHVVADDPDDDKFVECAIVASASLIVSSDRHLLDLKEYRDIHVVTPAAFVERMSKFE